MKDRAVQILEYLRRRHRYLLLAVECSPHWEDVTRSINEPTGTVVLRGVVPSYWRREILKR